MRSCVSIWESWWWYHYFDVTTIQNYNTISFLFKRSGCFVMGRFPKNRSNMMGWNYQVKFECKIKETMDYGPWTMTMDHIYIYIYTYMILERGPQTGFLCNLCGAIFVMLAEPMQWPLMLTGGSREPPVNKATFQCCAFSVVGIIEK